MPIVDTVYHCSRCHAEFPSAHEAEDCEARDAWGLKLEDYAPRMYEVLQKIDADLRRGKFDGDVAYHQVHPLLEELGPPPPPRKE